MERAAAVTRRGAGGVHVDRRQRLVAAAFRHRTSRAGDPQLHTHVLVANLTLGADGRWSTLDGRRIYAHAKTAGYLYEARLRGELTRELGVEWEPVRNGIADVAGVPPAVLRAFSRRRADIEAELERRGRDRAPRAAQVAALADAAAARTTASRRSSWCRSGASGPRELGLDRRARPRAARPRAAPSGSTPELVRARSPSGWRGPDGLTRRGRRSRGAT